MNLRRLELRDVPCLLAWMHDAGEAECFVRGSWVDLEHDLRFAIVSDDDVFMGVVCLQHIDGCSAEFSLRVVDEAAGRGYAWFGLEAMLERAFGELGLESVYWCVSRMNAQAIRFCEKHNFHEADDIPAGILARYPDTMDLRWYSVLKGDDINAPDVVAGCRVIHIKTIPTINAGELSFFESGQEIPFEIRRIYYISKVPEGVRRGFHAHKNLKQLLFCPYGRILLVLENAHGRKEIELSDPSIAVSIEEPTWREMIWLQKDSVLCVAASDYYDPDDYIRDYDLFKKQYGGPAES